MRTHGTLTKWNDDRGFGFISPAQGSDELFVHVSAFPRDGERPRINELISFETETGPNGKLRAVRVMRPRSQRKPHHARQSKSHQSTVRPAHALLAALLVAAIGAYGYSRLDSSVTPYASDTGTSVAPTPSTSTFKCDGRTMCSQMTSCAEAIYFLQHCPNPQMDGNGDGEPCEQQWCD